MTDVPIHNPQPVQMLDFSRQYASIRQELLDAIEAVCASQRFIQVANGRAAKNPRETASLRQRPVLRLSVCGHAKQVRVEVRFSIC